MEKGLKNLMYPIARPSSSTPELHHSFAYTGDMRHSAPRSPTRQDRDLLNELNIFDDSGCFVEEDDEALTDLGHVVGHRIKPTHGTKSKDDFKGDLKDDTGFLGGPNLSSAELAARFLDPASIKGH